MNETDRSAPGGDDQDGDADPASRPRPPALLWAAGGALAFTQVLIVVLAPGHWRTAGAVLLAAVTLGVVGWAVFGDRGSQ